MPLVSTILSSTTWRLSALHLEPCRADPAGQPHRRLFLGVSRETLVNQPLSLFVLRQDQDIFIISTVACCSFGVTANVRAANGR